MGYENKRIVRKENKVNNNKLNVKKWECECIKTLTSQL